MFNTTRSFGFLFIYLLKSMKALGKIKQNQKNGVDCSVIINNTALNWGKQFVEITGTSVTVEFEERIPSGPVCFICNHQSFFDIPLLLGYINKPKAFVSKIEVKKIPLISDWMTLMKCVFMDRKDIRQSVLAIKEGSQNMIDGQSMVIFPEGTRSKTGLVGDFKAGSFKMAINAKVPIVPLTIINSRNIYEANGNRIKPAKVKIIVNQPQSTSDLSKEEISELLRNTHELISSQNSTNV